MKDIIKYLENISLNINNSIDELKKIMNKIDENKEELKIQVSKIFTKIRSALNEREDYLILEVDKQYENTFFNEDIIKESEKLPNKIQELLKTSKFNEEDWNDN